MRTGDAGGFATLIPRDFPKYPRRENLDFTSSPYLILRRTWLSFGLFAFLRIHPPVAVNNENYKKVNLLESTS